MCVCVCAITAYADCLNDHFSYFQPIFAIIKNEEKCAHCAVVSARFKANSLGQCSTIQLMFYVC